MHLQNTMSYLKTVAGIWHGGRAFGGPILATVELTYRCNIVCRHCNFFSPHLESPKQPGIVESARLTLTPASPVITDGSACVWTPSAMCMRAVVRPDRSGTLRKTDFPKYGIAPPMHGSGKMRLRSTGARHRSRDASAQAVPIVSPT
jgi:hypothetical protein